LISRGDIKGDTELMGHVVYNITAKLFFGSARKSTETRHLRNIIIQLSIGFKFDVNKIEVSFLRI
jgi:hypothetical protein